MSDFRALNSFIDQVAKAAQPINEGSKDYFFSIIAPQKLAELGRETWLFYKAAEDEIQLNVSQLKDKKEELVKYLDEVKVFMDEPPLFRSMVIEGSEFVNKGLIIPNSHLSTSERALQQINQLVTQAWDLDPDTGVNAGSGQLSFSSKKYIAFLLLYEAGAYECWKRIEATVERHKRLTQPSRSSVSERHKPLDFDLESFLGEVGMKVITFNAIEPILKGIKAIVRNPEGIWEVTKWGATGHPFVAVIRLLILFKKAHETTRGNLQLWVKFFEYYYGIVLDKSRSKLQLESKNKVFQKAVDQANTHIILQIPSLKPGYKRLNDSKQKPRKTQENLEKP